MTHTAIIFQHYPKDGPFAEEIYATLVLAKTPAKPSYPIRYFSLRRMLWGL